MKDYVITLAEAVRLARRELEICAASDPNSAGITIKRLSELLERDEINDALAALEAVDDAPLMKSDPPADYHVPYPWRARGKIGMR